MTCLSEEVPGRPFLFETHYLSIFSLLHVLLLCSSYTSFGVATFLLFYAFFKVVCLNFFK